MCRVCSTPWKVPDWLCELLGLPEGSHCTGYTGQYIWNKLGLEWTREHTILHDSDDYSLQDRTDMPTGDVSWYIHQEGIDTTDKVLAVSEILEYDNHRVFIGDWVSEYDIPAGCEIMFDNDKPCKWYYGDFFKN